MGNQITYIHILNSTRITTSISSEALCYNMKNIWKTESYKKEKNNHNLAKIPYTFQLIKYCYIYVFRSTTDQQTDTLYVE